MKYLLILIHVLFVAIIFGCIHETNEYPECEIIKPDMHAALTPDTIVMIEFTASDPENLVKSIELKIDDSIVQSYSVTDEFIYEWNTQGISKGNHTISVIIIDNEDNYSTNSISVSYSMFEVPKVLTSEISNIKPYYAECFDSIVSQETIYKRGICWATHENPTLDDFVNDYNVRVKNLPDLTPNTTYYVRAFGRNTNGIGYGNQVVFTTPEAHFASGANIVDIDNNTYATVEIGTQTWMAENLKTKHYNDGSNVIYVYPNLDENNFQDYGLLYNWNTITSNSICPSGWSIPNSEDWTELLTYLGWTKAGGKVKEQGYDYWNQEGELEVSTNISNFSARAAGRFRDQWAYDFKGNAWFWTSTQHDGTTAAAHAFNHTQIGINPSFQEKLQALSVRCIKN